MAILIDPPRWPAHGILWSHLISDSSLDELHEFARLLGLPRRSFDLDHYDIADFNHAAAVAAGARPVSGHELVHALHASGLRIRKADRALAKAALRRDFLHEEWRSLGARLQPAVPAQWDALGLDLVRRWDEPQRVYHDLRHLEDVLLALDHLEKTGEQIPESTLLAAWFHDAVYAGQTGEDERDSAALARDALSRLGFAESLARDVSELVLATAPGADVANAARPLAQLLDADLAIFGSTSKRYAEYATAVRAEYAHVPEADFRRGRALILRGYLDRPRIYRLESAVSLWEARARENLRAEIASLTAA
ncbi:DUF4031 domain-containing protein [Gulosibacter molinativorax]|uniref:DUF4031 domain-containing protein n=1 Tax=Gulosibacter molinativorax TaxID=256821 RepID=A0ABT7C4L9_9MICO|nr:DUF4031 domain-containing protein [Gulosibacter molinativorax]MDJ1370150.1 DUF4031 domain-containing protein [Gulosibacter molinativorax]QUY61561.1 Putative HD superfamily hydrolase [Gulosibacter molinativorax]